MTVDGVGKTNLYSAQRLEWFPNTFTVVLSMFTLICSPIEQFTSANDLMRWKGFIWAWFMMLDKGLWFSTTSCVYIWVLPTEDVSGDGGRQSYSKFYDYKPMLAYRTVSIQSLQIFFPFETQIKANLCVSAPSLVTGTFYYAHVGQGSSSPIKMF